MKTKGAAAALAERGPLGEFGLAGGGEDRLIAQAHPCLPAIARNIG
jgi:hypothetical protein